MLTRQLHVLLGESWRSSTFAGHEVPLPSHIMAETSQSPPTLSSSAQCCLPEPGLDLQLQMDARSGETLPSAWGGQGCKPQRHPGDLEDGEQGL